MKKVIMMAIVISSLISAGIAQTSPTVKKETAKTKMATSTTPLLAANTKPVRKEMPAPLQDTTHKSKKSHKDMPKHSGTHDKTHAKSDSTNKKTKH